MSNAVWFEIQVADSACTSVFQLCYLLAKSGLQVAAVRTWPLWPEDAVVWVQDHWAAEQIFAVFQSQIRSVSKCRPLVRLPDTPGRAGGSEVAKARAHTPPGSPWPGAFR